MFRNVVRALRLWSNQLASSGGGSYTYAANRELENTGEAMLSDTEVMAIYYHLRRAKNMKNANQMSGKKCPDACLKQCEENSQLSFILTNCMRS